MIVTVMHLCTFISLAVCYKCTLIIHLIFMTKLFSCTHVVFFYHHVFNTQLLTIHQSQHIKPLPPASENYLQIKLLILLHCLVRFILISFCVHFSKCYLAFGFILSVLFAARTVCQDYATCIHSGYTGQRIIKNVYSDNLPKHKRATCSSIMEA